MLKKIVNISNFVFAITIVLLYLVIIPILLHNEYQNNEKFKNLIICEENNYNFNSLYESNVIFENKCPLKNIQDKLLKKSNFIINFTIIFWALIIFENDIYPNRKKIIEFFEKLN